MSRVFHTGFESGNVSGIWDLEAGSGITADTATTRGAWSTYSMRTTSGTFHRRSIPTISEVYLRFGFRFVSVQTVRFLGFLTGTTVQSSLALDASPKLVAYRGDGSTLVGTGTSTLAINTWYLLEVYLKVADSGGRFIVRLNGTTEIDFTGDTQNHASVASIDNFGLRGVGGSQATFFDDVALNSVAGSQNNSWVGDGRITGLLPNAAGDSTQLSVLGSATNWQNVDERPPNDVTDYNFGTTAGLKDLYGLTDPSNVASVNAVSLVTRAAKDDAGAASVVPKIKAGTGGGAPSTESSGANRVLSTTWTSYFDVFETNPATTAAFTAAELNPLQAGVETA